jgi:hypothetical protein
MIKRLKVNAKIGVHPLIARAGNRNSHQTYSISLYKLRVIFYLSKISPPGGNKKKGRKDKKICAPMAENVMNDRTSGKNFILSSI